MNKSSKGLILLAALVLLGVRKRSGAKSSISKSDRLNMLMSAYDVERQDQEQATLIAMALITIGSAFIGGALLFLNVDCTTDKGCQSLPPALILGLPIFPLALLGFLMLNLAATIAREQYILEIERLIARLTEARRATLPTPYYMHISRIIWGGGDWKNFHYKLASSFVYTSLFAIAAGFCLAVLTFVREGWGTRIAIAIYSLFIGVELLIFLGAVLRPKRIEYLREQAAALFWRK